MNQEDIAMLELIMEDCEKDAAAIDGQPFNGHTVSTQFGCQLSMISALAEVLRTHIKAGADVKDRLREAAAEQSRIPTSAYRQGVAAGLKMAERIVETT